MSSHGTARWRHVDAALTHSNHNVTKDNELYSLSRIWWCYRGPPFLLGYSRWSHWPEVTFFQSGGWWSGHEAQACICSHMHKITNKSGCFAPITQQYIQKLVRFSNLALHKSEELLNWKKLQNIAICTEIKLLGYFHNLPSSQHSWIPSCPETSLYKWKFPCMIVKLQSFPICIHHRWIFLRAQSLPRHSSSHKSAVAVVTP